MIGLCDTRSAAKQEEGLRVLHMTPAIDARLLDELTAIVSRAAAAIVAKPLATLAARTKADLSPVTAADEASESVLLDGLARLLPGLPIVSEEAGGEAAACFVLVDPLDGTRELLAGRDEFTINLAIIAGQRPVLGIVCAPALALLWRGSAGGGAQRIALAPGADPARARPAAIRTRRRPSNGLVAAVSRSHLDAATEAFVARWPNVSRLVCGSAIKFCRVAEGAADLYPRLSPTSEWDVAAGHAVLAAAGGTVTGPDGMPLLYGRPGFRVPAFIAWGDPESLPLSPLREGAG
jgi:3'(2'), 5'-bisphosphate nucleotidase